MVERAPQEEIANADTTPLGKKANPKQIAKDTKTFDGFTSLSNHYLDRPLPVNSPNNGAQGIRGGLTVVIMQMQSGREKHSPPKSN